MPTKKKSKPNPIEPSTITNESLLITQEPTPNIKMTISEVAKPVKHTIAWYDDPSKKKGRKPKGGKLISKFNDIVEKDTPIPNVILHLKCSLADLVDYNNMMNRMVTNELVYNPEIPPEIHTFTYGSGNFSKYDDSALAPVDSKIVDQENIAYTDNSLFFPGVKKGATIQVPQSSGICKKCNCKLQDDVDFMDTEEEDPNINMKNINHKLKNLKIHLYKNTLQDKKSACFWCSYDFDNQPCYIPKYELDDKIYGYGSFCRPECAVAYLMKENLDDSTKFERYHLLNHIYSKVYEYKKNIKPAPNPYYLLDKYFGNLTIQEYRKLLKTEHLFTVIDKPMSRTLPELFEDNDSFILGVYGNIAKSGGSSQNTHKNVYKVKRQSEKNAVQGPSKTDIMKDKFGLA